MRRSFLFLAAAGLAGSLASGATPIYVTPDVPTTETATSTTFLPSQIARYTTPGPVYTVVLTVPGNPHVDAIQKLDAPGGWLFSVADPSNLAGSLGADAQPHDVVRLLTGTYTMFFDGASQGIPAAVNLDALSTEGGDGGNLVVSFDAPVELPAGSGTFYDSADLVRFTRTGAPPLGWTFLPAGNPVFDASSAGAGGIETSYNTIGGFGTTAGPVLALDAPARLDPSVGPLDYESGQLARYNAGSNDFSLFEELVGWPKSSLIHGVSGAGNPGRVPVTIRLSKVPGPTDIVIDWSASCSEGASDYGIYEGTIGAWYSHTQIDCNDSGADTVEQVTPGAGNRYYLVVPFNGGGEGSYGQCSAHPAANAAGCPLAGNERPLGASRCATPQIVSGCP